MALLGMTVKQAYISVPLESREDGLHFGRLEDERLAKTTTYILTVKSELPENQVADQLPKLSKIASWTDVGEIVHAATPGVPLQVTYRPPAEIPVRAGLVYFQLATNDRFWRNVAGERTVAIYLPPPFDPAHIKLELLAVPPPEK
jgi:type VI secretion system protein ImpJ